MYAENETVAGAERSVRRWAGGRGTITVSFETDNVFHTGLGPDRAPG